MKKEWNNEELLAVARIKKSIERISSNTLNIESIIVSEEEYLLCEKYGLDMSKISSVGRGNNAHRFAYYNKNGKIGAHTPRDGYYKIIRIEKDVNIQYEPFIIKNAIYAWFKLKYADKFEEEEVLINSKPLYNKISVGPKDRELKVGLIIKVNSTTLEDSSYKIIWDIFENELNE